MQRLKYLLCFLGGAGTLLLLSSFFDQLPSEKYILVKEKDIAKEQPGPHNGGGLTIAFPFFEGTRELKMVFRKRVLRPGAAIGYHLQETDEIYYILTGQGEMQMNGKSFEVTAGDAILTRPGSRHGLKQVGNGDLTLLINYNLK